MKVYFDPVSKGFYQSDIHIKIPPSAIEITDEKRWELIEGQSNGKVIVVKDNEVTLQDDEPTEEDKAIVERLWRDAELARADIELYKVQDSDPKAVGTVAGWREYRKALRAWPEHKDFPDTSKRPVAPDAVVEDIKE